MRTLLLLLASLVAAPTFAASALATVSAVQPPAWIETAGHKHALPAGQVVVAGDRITTGAGGRVHVELADDSIVKLGENADFRVPALSRDESRNEGLFKGALKVLTGAFRFTTRALAKHTPREIDVTIGVATAGIRGTDIWGKSDAREDLIALLEGKIDVSTQGQPPQRMEQAGTFFVVPRGAAPLPVKPAPAKTIADWAAQTELAPDGIAMYAAGPHSVTVARLPTREQARAEVQRLSDRGYAAEVSQDGDHFAAVMNGFGSKAEAARFGRQLRQARLTDR